MVIHLSFDVKCVKKLDGLRCIVKLFSMILSGLFFIETGMRLSIGRNYVLCYVGSSLDTTRAS